MAFNLSNETWGGFFGYQMDRRKSKEKQGYKQQLKLDDTGILGKISDHITPSSMATQIHHNIFMIYSSIVGILQHEHP